MEPAEHLQPALVVQNIVTHATKQRDLASSLSTLVTQITEAACVFSVLGQDKIDRLRATLSKVLVTREAVQAHHAALQHLAGSYRPTMEPTDFAGLIKAKLDSTLAARNFKPDTCTDMRTFQQWIGDEAAASTAAAASDELEDDFAMESTTAVNARCPITSKEVDKLEDAVEDQKGYIYDREAITTYIRNQGGQAECPVAGCQHMISAATLKPSVKHQRNRKRARYLGSAPAEPPANRQRRKTVIIDV